MSEFEKLKKRVNLFLENHTFTVPILDFFGDVTVKIKLLNLKNYIVVGTDTPILTYEIKIINTSDEKVDYIISTVMKNKNEIDVLTYSSEFLDFRFRIDSLLRDFLKLVGFENQDVICTKISLEK